MRIRIHDDRGVAMVTALMVSFVVLLLSVSVIAVSVHNSTSSGYDRRRLLAVDAAEAGVDDYYHHMSVTAPSSFDCSRVGTVDSGPNEAEWDASIALSRIDPATGDTVATSCPPPAGVTPVAALITSTGRSPSGTLLRTMQSYVRLTPVFFGTGAAIFATSTTNVTNKVTIQGNDGANGNIYVSCTASPCSLSMSNNQLIAGSLYVLGSVSLSNNVVIQGDVWARDGVTVSTGATVNGDVISSTGAISVTSPASIGGNATAGTTVADQSRVGGTVLQTTPSGDPPSYALPQITFDSTEVAAWEAERYEIRTFTDCATARTFILGFGTVPVNVFGTYNYVARITAVCAMTFANLTSINMPGNLAIITEGSISMSNQVTWTALTSDRKLFLVSRYRTGLSCAGGTYDVSTSNNANFLNVYETPKLEVFLYSPCAVNLSNQNAFSGQAYATTVNVQNQTTINYVPVAIPGVTDIVGFEQEPQYVREVA